jgi:phosphatidylserine decarboxylase
VRLLPRRRISHIVGQVCDASLPPSISRAVVKLYGRAYRVDMKDVVPIDGSYDSFDAYFTRELVPESRPISQTEGDVVSPADGVLQSIGRVERGCRLLVKGRGYDVARLVGDEDDARGYVGGQFAVVYLSPRDYHRLHAPVAGTVGVVRSMSGDLFPVNRIGECCSRSLLVTNQRVAVVIETEDLGRVTVVLVGAMIVGRITVAMILGRDVPSGAHRVDPPYPLARGQELGAFHLGSTAVVLVGPDAPAWHREPGLIRVGESLVRCG